MANHDPEFYQAPKFSPEYDNARPRQRGCFFYGCVIASVLAVLLIIALAVLAYMGMRFFSGFVEEWTSPAPVELPKVQVSEEERKSVRERVDAFRKALEEGTAIDPLVLTSDDLNALIEENSDLRGRLFARVEGDKLKAQISFPLDKLRRSGCSRDVTSTARPSSRPRSATASGRDHWIRSRSTASARRRDF